jgi:hypothetical protein
MSEFKANILPLFCVIFGNTFRYPGPYATVILLLFIDVILLLKRNGTSCILFIPFEGHGYDTLSKVRIMDYVPYLREPFARRRADVCLTRYNSQPITIIVHDEPHRLVTVIWIRIIERCPS